MWTNEYQKVNLNGVKEKYHKLNLAITHRGEIMEWTSELTSRGYIMECELTSRGEIMEWTEKINKWTHSYSVEEK